MANEITKLDVTIPARSLFHFAVPCYFQDPLWGPSGALLSERHRLPNLALVDGISYRVEVRAGWNEEAFALQFRVFDEGVARRIAEAGRGTTLSIWINTRAAQDVHRATRFCHYFEIQPTKARKGEMEAKVTWRAIPKAKDVPNSPPPQSLAVKIGLGPDQRDYTVDVIFTREALTGYDPREYPRIALNFEVKGLGSQLLTFSAGPPLPYREDPSLWVTLDLVKA